MIHRQHSATNTMFIPSNSDSKIAAQSKELLASYLKLHKKPVLSFTLDNPKHEALKLPGPVAKLLLEILTLTAKGSPLSVLQANKELTTQKAAELLNVSRPFLVQLLEEDKIPFRKVGTKRRVLAQDIMAYKQTIDDARYKTLEKLSKQAQKLQMGYELD